MLNVILGIAGFFLHPVITVREWAETWKEQTTCPQCKDSGVIVRKYTPWRARKHVRLIHWNRDDST